MKERSERNGYGRAAAGAEDGTGEEDEQWQQQQPLSKRARYDSPMENGGKGLPSGEVEDGGSEEEVD
jgi:hypothetical protein